MEPGNTVAVNSPHKILEVRVEEANGLNKDDQPTWDQEIKEGFVKAEVRGNQSKPIKASTRTVRVQDGHKMIWHEDLYLDIQEGATELRLLLCREKQNGNKRGVSVVTACGIYITDVLEAVPIDKYFEMFKPGSGLDGGFVRLKMRLVSEEDIKKKQAASASERTGSGLLKLMVITGALVAAALWGKRRFA